MEQWAMLRKCQYVSILKTTQLAHLKDDFHDVTSVQLHCFLQQDIACP